MSEKISLDSSAEYDIFMRTHKRVNSTTTTVKS